MPREVFVDSAAWYAVADPGDTFYQAASTVYSGLLRRRNLVTINLVVAEAHALILHRVHRAAALQFLGDISSTPQLTVVYATPELEAEALALLRQYADQDFSLADAISFIVMRRQKIKEAFTFDHHFLTAGFTLVPALATP